MHFLFKRLSSRYFTANKSSRAQFVRSTATMEQADLFSAKKHARQLFKERLKIMSSDVMKAESERICSQVLAWPPFSSATRIGVYVHCERLREVDTSVILSSALDSLGKRCYVPVVEDKSSNMKLLHIEGLTDLIPVPPYGILEPTSSYQGSDRGPREDMVKDRVALDLVIMPGLGFCPRSGARLGRGGGYYDKLLSRLIAQAKEDGRDPPLFVALAFSGQLCGSGENLPMGENDLRVNVLVTEQSITQFT